MEEGAGFLWPCLLRSWQRGHGTNGVKFQPCSDPFSSLCPHALGPGCWVGQAWHPCTHTWDFSWMETPRTLVSYLLCQLPPTAWVLFTYSGISLSASSPPDYISAFALRGPEDVGPLSGTIFDVWLPYLVNPFEEKMWGWGEGVGKLSFVDRLYVPGVVLGHVRYSFNPQSSPEK